MKTKVGTQDIILRLDTIQNQGVIPHIKMCPDVQNRLGTPHIKMCSDVQNRVGTAHMIRVGTPHIILRKSLAVGGWVGEGWLGRWLHLVSWNLQDSQLS